MKRTTINDVADAAGVSNATVSAVINDKGTVRASTRKRVLQAIEQLNYRPSASARRRFQPVSQRAIGLVVKEVQNPYFADIFLGVQQVASEKGYAVLIVSSEGNYDQERNVVDVLASKDVDGLIINPLVDDAADLSHIFELKRRNIPFVLLESVRGLQASLVDVDNVAASEHAVNYLIGMGHQRIVHFAGPRYSMHSDERIEGVRLAFSESNLVFGKDGVVYAGATITAGYEAGLNYFRSQSEDRPTAVTCYNDLVAVGLLKALRELQIRVPEDVSIIGYDDISMADSLMVPLTTVRVPKVEMGARAAEMLIRQMEAAANQDSNGRSIDKILLSAELVIRSSTAPLKVGRAQLAS